MKVPKAVKPQKSREIFFCQDGRIVVCKLVYSTTICKLVLRTVVSTYVEHKPDCMYV